MKIILVYPRGYDNASGRPSISTLATTLPPLGLASIASVLRKGGHDVKLFDAALFYKTANTEWIRRIISEKPAYVGFSAITPSFHDAYSICKGIKEADYTIQTVFGGVHVSWGKELVMHDFPAIDYVVAGEGEYSFLKLVAGEKPETIPGLYFRDGQIVKAGPIQTKKDLCVMDELPFPAYEIIPGFPKRYTMALFCYPHHPTASIVSSRGCVYQCSFCDRSVFQQTFRWNSPEYTFELVKWLRTDFGVRHVMFYDDLFTLNRDRVAALCALLRAGKRPVTFNCIVRIGHIDDELIRELKTAGCWMVTVGIESGDQAILDANKDGLLLDRIRADIERLHRGGIWVKGLFMMGFPQETEESLQKTITFACSLPLKDANITAFTPYPGSPVAQKIDSLGTFDHNRDTWADMDCVNFVFLPKGIESVEKLQVYYKEFIRQFYHRDFMKAVYRKMVLQSPHSYWRLLKHGIRFREYARNMKK